MQLIIGNKNYSSWSQRPWLLLSVNRIPFEEIRIPLYTPATGSMLSEYTDAGKVPVLHDGDVVVWDSLAICEYVSEQYLDGEGWPVDYKSRAQARACSAEMHSGFFQVREKLPMNCRATGRKVDITPILEAEINRIIALWSSLRNQYAAAGPWLFGGFSIADCMFAPVASRFRTYDIALPGACSEYVEQLLSHEMLQAWYRQAEEESEVIELSEVGT